MHKHLRLPVWIVGFISSLVASCSAASRRHLFADAAFREELLLLLLEPTPHAAIRLMNQRQRYVAELLLAPSLEIRPIVLLGSLGRLVSRIFQIRCKDTKKSSYLQISRRLFSLFSDYSYRQYVNDRFFYLVF